LLLVLTFVPSVLVVWYERAARPATEERTVSVQLEFGHGDHQRRSAELIGLTDQGTALRVAGGYR
jgi:hypothetical protein